jgi:hypothetical protein
MPRATVLRLLAVDTAALHRAADELRMIRDTIGEATDDP